MSTNTITTYRIKADYGYYSNTYNAPKDGYLLDEPTAEPLTFNSIEKAHEHLTSSHDGYTCGTGCEYDGDGTYSMSGTYTTAHGQHSRPRYTIVNTASGRCNKAIIAACDKLANA